DAGRAALLANCRALVQPSRNESYSRTMMEAWLHAKPVVAHSECLATGRAVEASGGGWAAASEAEWAETFTVLEAADESMLRERGERGRAYALEHADWEKAIQRYEVALELRPSARARPMPRPSTDRAIHQLLQGLYYGDAISD